MQFRIGKILMVGLLGALTLQSCTPFRLYPTNTEMGSRGKEVQNREELAGDKRAAKGFMPIQADGAGVDFGVQKFDTLTPTLRWSPFRLYEGVFTRTQKSINNLRYRLVVYPVKTLADLRFNRYLRLLDHRKLFDYNRYEFVPDPGMWFVDEKNLTETSYTFSKPLEPNTTYVWSVTSEYDDGDTHYENSAWILLKDGESNAFLYSFDTP